MIKLKEGEEKQKRAREAREKAEAEKAARAARKRALVDMNAHETQEGVMDSLMEALQTGSAFSRPDQRRKRQTRVAGGKFYRTTFIQRRMMKKDRTTRPYILNNTLSESTNLTRDCKNVTPIEVAQRNAPPNGIMTEIHTADDPTSFYTPEENQDLFKQMLINEAKKTPKQKAKHLSRVMFFRKKRSCGHCSYTYYAAMQPESDETPKRDVSLKTLGNLESRGVTADCYSSPLVSGSASINLARMISPVKEQRVIVSKLRRRNSIVRRAILNRKRLHASNTITKRRRLRSASNLSSPSSITATTPVVSTSITNANSVNVKRRMSNSFDGVHTKILKTASSPIKLLRSKNFENLARYQDENQNVQYSGSGSTNLNLSAKYSSAEQISIVQSPLLIEMSGVTLLSGNSPLHFVNASKTSGTSAKSRNIFKRSKNGARKKKWKFWQTSINTV